MLQFDSFVRLSHVHIHTSQNKYKPFAHLGWLGGIGLSLALATKQSVLPHAYFEMSKLNTTLCSLCSLVSGLYKHSFLYSWHRDYTTHMHICKHMQICIKCTQKHMYTHSKPIKIIVHGSRPWNVAWFLVELRLKTLETLKGWWEFHLFLGTRSLSLATVPFRFVAISHVRATPQIPFHAKDVNCSHIGSRQISILMRYIQAWRA